MHRQQIDLPTGTAQAAGQKSDDKPNHPAIASGQPGTLSIAA
jgi:hypothetical protein